MPVINILLPKCEDVEVDVFLLILKGAISRKSDDHYLVSALKFGMSGASFPIEESHLQMSWKDMSTKQQRIHQSRLLGFWTIKNYPLLGKKLRDSWENSEENGLLTNNQTRMSSDEINAIISRKLKLRVLQLDVCAGTVDRLKEFVNAPDNIDILNEEKMSKQMKSFDIDESWTDHCWGALKSGQSGEFVIDEQVVNTSRVPQPEDKDHRMRSEFDGISVASKRTYRAISDTNDGNDTDNVSEASSSGPSSVKARKRSDIGIVNVEVLSLDTQSVLAPRANVDTDSEIDSIQILLKIQSDIGHLTNLFQERNNNSSADRLFLEMMKKKDDQISELNETIRGLRETNENIANDQLKLVKQIDAKTALVSTLQLGLDATSTLRERYERDKTENLNSLEEMNSRVTKANETICKLTDEIKSVNDAKHTLQSEFLALKNSNVELPIKRQLTEANEKIAEMKNEITAATEAKHQLQSDFLASEKNNVELSSELRTKIDALAASASLVESRERQLSEANEEIAKMTNEIITATEAKHQLQSEFLASEKNNVELSSELRIKIEALAASASLVESRERQLSEANEEIAKMTNEITVVTEAKRQLHEQVFDLKICSDALSTELKTEIGALANNVASTEKTKSATELANKNLREQLAFSEQRLAAKEEELKELRRTWGEIRKPDISSNAIQMPAKSLFVEKISCLQSMSEPNVDQDIYSEPMKSAGDCADEVLKVKGYEPDPRDEVTEPTFKSEDEIVQKCRPILLNQTFGWMKFQSFKNSKYHPGFVYAADADGKERAQKVKADGYITDSKNIFYDFHKELPESLKRDAEKSALKKFNERFRLSFK